MKQGMNTSPMSEVTRGLLAGRRGLKLATAGAALSVFALSAPSVVLADSSVIVRSDYNAECRTIDEGAGVVGEILEGVPIVNMSQSYALKLQAQISEGCRIPDEVWTNANQPMGGTYRGRDVVSYGGRLAATGAIFANSGMYVTNTQWVNDPGANHGSDIEGFTIPVVGAPLWSGMVNYTRDLYMPGSNLGNPQQFSQVAGSTMIEMNGNKVRNVHEIGFKNEGVVSGVLTQNGTVTTHNFYRTLNITDNTQMVTGKDLEWLSAALRAVDGRSRVTTFNQLSGHINALSDGMLSASFTANVALLPLISGQLSSVSAALLAKPNQFTPLISNALQSQLQALRNANPYGCVGSVSTMCDLLVRANGQVNLLSGAVAGLSSVLLTSGGNLALIPAMSSQLSSIGGNVNTVSSIVATMQAGSGAASLMAISSVIAKASVALGTTIPLTTTLSGIVSGIDSQVRNSQAIVNNLTTSFNSVSGAIVTLNTRYLTVSSQVAAGGGGSISGSNPLLNLQGQGSAPIVDGSAAGGLAIGWGARVGAGHTNSVAIGYNSSTSGPNEFSIGSATNLRRLTNVADGVNANDVVNKGQVDAAFANAGGGTIDINKYEKRAAASASMAGALANMPSVDLTRQFGVSAGAAGYGGRTAWSVGASTRIQDHFVFKAGYSRSNGQSMYNAGGNIMW